MCLGKEKKKKIMADAMCLVKEKKKKISIGNVQVHVGIFVH